MKKKNQKESLKQLTFCSMLVALGVVFLGIGAVLDVLDISMAVLASACIIITMIEYKTSTSWMVYAAISLLSLLLLPNKTPVLFFMFFFGFYPILKPMYETRSKVVCWILKEVTFNISFAVIIVLYGLLFFKDVSMPIPLHWFLVIIVVACEFVFVLYDIALKRMILFYIFKIRKKLKFK